VVKAFVDFVATMYKLDPIIDTQLKPEIPFPFCMYSLPRISPALQPGVFEKLVLRQVCCPTSPLWRLEKWRKWNIRELFNLQMNCFIFPFQDGGSQDGCELDQILTRQRALLENLNLLKKRLEDLKRPRSSACPVAEPVAVRKNWPTCGKPAQPVSSIYLLNCYNNRSWKKKKVKR
jgi:hypothetical protein